MSEETTIQEGTDVASDAPEKGVYELAYHLVPTLTDDDRTARVESLRKLVEDAGGIILNEINPEHTTLAYTMTKPIAGKLQKFESAYFGWVTFELDRENIAALKEVCDKDETILRYLITTTTKELAMTQTRPTILKEVEPVRTPVPAEEPVVAGVPEEEKAEEMSEEEVDKAIDDLVVDEEVKA